MELKDMPEVIGVYNVFDYNPSSWSVAEVTSEDDFLYVRKDLAYPQPSTNLTTPISHPYKNHLLWVDGDWVVGYYDPVWGSFVAPLGDAGYGPLRPSHWLPLPGAPNNRPNE